MGIAHIKENMEPAIELMEDINAGVRDLKDIIDKLSDDMETMEVDYKDEEAIDELFGGYEYLLTELDESLSEIQTRTAKTRSVIQQLRELGN